jgi:REP element-mobilizing transposase RayT
MQVSHCVLSQIPLQGFEGQVGEYARQQVYHLVRQKDLIELKEINVQPDNVHTILSISPKCAISDMISESGNDQYL